MAFNTAVEELAGNKEFMEKLQNIHEAEAFSTAVEAAGLDIDEVVKGIAENVSKDGELNDKELDKVSGGLLTEAAAIAIVTTFGPMAVRGVACMTNNMRKDGSFRRCDCGLHVGRVRN